MLHARFRQRFGVLADVAAKVVVEVIAEESQDARLSDAVVGQHAFDFAFDIRPGPHAPFDDCLPQFFVWLDVSQRVIDRQAQFPVLEHDASMAIRFAVLGKFRPEERVAIEKDG